MKETSPSDLIEENQLLKKRVKELELRNDITNYKNSQQKIQDFTNTYIRLLYQDYTSSSSSSSSSNNVLTSIIKINSKIDMVFVLIMIIILIINF